MPSQPTFEWQLSQLMPGAEILVKDERGRPVARGTLRDDRVSLLGPNGEHISLENRPGWKLVVVRRRDDGAGPWGDSR